jgi:phospholipid/cholesterol/gamma-HCH transport system substrate-binding protein
MNVKTNFLKLGIFVIIAVIAFITIIYRIGNKQNTFGSDLKVKIDFKDVNGLQRGNNVRFSGITIGTIDDIFVLNDSLIRVVATLDKTVKPFIRTNATASIASDGLVGSMILNIIPGNSNAAVIKSGDILKSTATNSTEEVIKSVGILSNKLIELTDQIKEITGNISNGQGPISMLLNDKDLSLKVKSSLLLLSNASVNVDHIISDLNQTVKQLHHKKGIINYLETDTLLSATLKKSNTTIDTVININLVEMVENINRSTKDLNEVTLSIKKITHDINHDKGIVNALTKDTTMRINVISSLKNINEGTEKINEVLDALKNNFLLRRYFRKEKND